MNIYQKRLPLFLILVLVGILILQYVSNDQNSVLIDPQTCELYIKDSQIGGKKYLDEFDSKCLDLKNLNS